MVSSVHGAGRPIELVGGSDTAVGRRANAVLRIPVRASGRGSERRERAAREEQQRWLRDLVNRNAARRGDS